MSNTSSISPYENDSEISNSYSYEPRDTGGSSSLGGICAGACNLVRWFCQSEDEDRAAVDRSRKLQRDERLKGFLATGETHRITTTRLTLPSLEPLLQSAQKLGYAPMPLSAPSPSLMTRTAERLGSISTPLSMRGSFSLSPSTPRLGDAPAAIARRAPSSVLLQKDTGERLAIFKDKDGLMLTTAGDMKQVHALMRQHTQDRVLEHLGKRMAMDIQTARLANGEVQISARETSLRHGDGQARMKVQVREDGRLWVDVDGLRSKRCEEEISGLAEAVGGEITSMKKKLLGFTLPGEPARTRLKV